MDIEKLSYEVLAEAKEDFNYVTIKKEKLINLCNASRELYSEVDFLKGCLGSDQIVAHQSAKEILKKWGED